MEPVDYIYLLPVNRVYYDASFNVRGEFTVQSCSELAESIREEGQDIEVIVQPIGDMPDPRPDGYDWRLLAGHRRFIAITQLLRWDKIKAKVRIGLTEAEARKLNFRENVERKSLNVLEEARWLGTYFPEGTSLRTMAAEIDKDTRWVHIRLRLLKLPEEVQQKAASGILSLTDIGVISALDTVDKQLQAARDLEVAKRQGRSGEVGNRYGRKFRYKLSKAEIGKLIRLMLENGITGLAPRVAARCAGYISHEELLVDIQKEVEDQRSRHGVVI